MVIVCHGLAPWGQREGRGGHQASSEPTTASGLLSPDAFPFPSPLATYCTCGNRHHKLADIPDTW
eukprot:6190136-Prorocentrum_lima.AAC.1